MDEDEYPLYIGINLPARHGVSNQQVVDEAISQGFDLVTARITSRQYRKRIQTLYELHDIEIASNSVKSTSIRTSNTAATTDSTLSGVPPVRAQVPAPTGEDVIIFPGSHVANTIALAAPWVELDSKDDNFADISFQVLEHEFSYARFCGLPYIVLEGPRRRTHVARYAHSLDKLLRDNPHIKVMIHTTFTEDFRKGRPPSDLLSTWDVWDALRTICDYPSQLYLALEVQSYNLSQYVLSRWFCEPVAMLILSAPQLYVPNPKKYPVLPKHLQELVLQYAPRRPYFLLKDSSPLGNDYAGGDTGPLLYLRHLFSSLRQSDFAQAEYSSVLQPPLQPLSQPLDSTVYEVFEEDTTKYDLYATAIRAALDAELQGCSRLVVCVAGAGRGALVKKILDISTEENRNVYIYAVEKNPGAAAYLSARMRSEQGWLNRVEIIPADIRSWSSPHRINLLVAELLGSLGDNELSPECLDGAQRLLDPNSSVVIPSSYTAFAAPVIAPALWANARAKEPKNNSLHQPYVVSLQQANRIAPPVPLWRFDHPTPYPGQTHRSAKVNFQIAHKSRVYGFAGYFEAELYPGVELSTNPLTQQQKSPNLASWFPIWFPLVSPIDVSEGWEIDLNLWREVRPSKVWYEWSAETFNREGQHRTRMAISPLHNAGGHAYTISGE